MNAKRSRTNYPRRVQRKGGTSKDIWAIALNNTSLLVRRRASYYLDSIKQVSSEEWLVWGRSGDQYLVKAKGGQVTCSCPYYRERREPCKHIAAVAADQLVKLDRRFPSG